MRSPIVYPLIIALAGLVFAQDSSANPLDQVLDDSALLERLRSGGLVIVFRHGNTGPVSDRADAVGGRSSHPGSPKERQAAYLDCDRQRNLSDEGRDELQLIAHSIRKIGLPIDDVFASPMCRTRETAWILFGQVISSEALIGPENETRSQLVVSAPANGTNRVLVSHGYVVGKIVANFEGVAANEIAPRAYGFVLEPDGKGDFAILARLGPEDWVRVASITDK